MRFILAALLLAVATSAAAAAKELESCEQDMGCSFDAVASDLITIRASSTLADEKDRYAVANLLDGSETSAWCEGKKDDGVGETITVEFKKPVQVDLILITPFYAKSFATAEENNRVKRMTLTLDDDKLEVEAGPHLVNMCSGKADPKDPCTERNAPQKLGLGKVRTLRKVTLTIDTVDRGSKYRDTCLSTLRFLQEP